MYSTEYRELWISGAETGLEPWHSTSLTPLRHSAGINALCNKSPALRECILFLGSNRDPQNRSPKKVLTRELLSTPAKMSPALTVPLTGSPSPPRPLRPPPPGLGRAAAAKCRRARPPGAHTPSRGPIWGRGCWTAAWAHGRRGGGGRMFRQGPRAPPRPEEPLGPVWRRWEKRGCAAVLQGARSQPPTRRPGPRPLLPGPGAPGPVQPAPAAGSSAGPRPQLQSPGPGPLLPTSPHLPSEAPGGVGTWRMLQAPTLGAIGTGSSSPLRPQSLRRAGSPAPSRQSPLQKARMRISCPAPQSSSLRAPGSTFCLNNNKKRTLASNQHLGHWRRVLKQQQPMTAQKES